MSSSNSARNLNVSSSQISSQAPANQDSTVSSEYNTKVVDEILTTENSFIHSLQHLSKIMNNADMVGISANNAKLFQDLYALVKMMIDSSPLAKEKIGVTNSDAAKAKEDAVLASMLSTDMNFYLQQITMYSSMYDAVLSYFKNAEGQLLDKIYLQGAQTNGLKLADFAIQPIQRIPRYNLLAADFYKHTPKGKPQERMAETIIKKTKTQSEISNEAVAAKISMPIARVFLALNTQVLKFTDSNLKDLKKSAVTDLLKTGAITNTVAEKLQTLIERNVSVSDYQQQIKAFKLPADTTKSLLDDYQGNSKHYMLKYQNKLLSLIPKRPESILSNLLDDNPNNKESLFNRDDNSLSYSERKLKKAIKNHTDVEAFKKTDEFTNLFAAVMHTHYYQKLAYQLAELSQDKALNLDANTKSYIGLYLSASYDEGVLQRLDHIGKLSGDVAREKSVAIEKETKLGYFAKRREQKMQDTVKKFYDVGSILGTIHYEKCKTSQILNSREIMRDDIAWPTISNNVLMQELFNRYKRYIDNVNVKVKAKHDLDSQQQSQEKSQAWQAVKTEAKKNFGLTADPDVRRAYKQYREAFKAQYAKLTGKINEAPVAIENFYYESLDKLKTTWKNNKVHYKNVSSVVKTDKRALKKDLIQKQLPILQEACQMAICLHDSQEKLLGAGPRLINKDAYQTLKNLLDPMVDKNSYGYQTLYFGPLTENGPCAFRQQLETFIKSDGFKTLPDLVQKKVKKLNKLVRSTFEVEHSLIARFFGLNSKAQNGEENRSLKKSR